MSPYITERLLRFGELDTDGLADPPAAFDAHLDLSERDATVSAA